MSKGRSRALSSAALAAMVAALGLSACGGGNDDGDSSASAQDPVYGIAAEPPRTFAERFAKLLETVDTKDDCGEVEAIDLRSYPSFDCPPEPAMRKSMKRFELLGARAYGTAAVVDYKSGAAKDGAAIVLFVAPDRNWGISRFGIFSPPSVGTKDSDSRDGYDEAIDGYLSAIRERDCDAFQDHAFTGGKEGQEVCRGQFKGTEELAERLKANPGAEPEYMGGNAVYGFYSLETAKPKPENSTISVLRSGSGDESVYDVLDLAPTPTAAEQREIVRKLRELRNQKTPPGGMAPSEDAKPSEPAVTTE